MGLRLTKERSNSQYASYEKTLAAVSTQIETLQDKLATRKARKASGTSQITLFGLAGFAITVLLAAWAMNQPPGRLSQRQHMNCILPLFLELLSWGLLRLLWSQATSLGSRRANSRLQKAQTKRKKLLAELKEATNLDRTLSLLRRFDPEFQEPTPPRRQGTGLRMVQSQPFGQAGKSPSATGTPRSGHGFGQHRRILPALDAIANALVGDSPALAHTLKETKNNVGVLQQQLQRAESRVHQLAADNARLREQLGMPPEEAGQEGEGPDAQGQDLDGPEGPLGRLRIASGAGGDMDRQRSCSAPVTPLSRLNPRMEALRGVPEQPQAAADSLGAWDLPPGEPAEGPASEPGGCAGTGTGEPAIGRDEGVAAAAPRETDASRQPAAEGKGRVEGHADAVNSVRSESS